MTSQLNVGDRVQLRTEPFPGWGFKFEIGQVSDCGTGYRVILPDGALFEIDNNDIIDARTGITPADGNSLALLNHIVGLAKDLIEAAELEKSGVRDGDGYWHGADPLEIAEDIATSYRALRCCGWL